MAYVADNIESQKSVREYLNSMLSSGQLYITTSEGEMPVLNVDVIWNGFNYYLAYQLANNDNYYIVTFDEVLPLVIKTVITDSGDDADSGSDT